MPSCQKIHISALCHSSTVHSFLNSGVVFVCKARIFSRYLNHVPVSDLSCLQVNELCPANICLCLNFMHLFYTHEYPYINAVRSFLWIYGAWWEKPALFTPCFKVLNSICVSHNYVKQERANWIPCIILFVCIISRLSGSCRHTSRYSSPPRL
jgi:hypothetical protein